MSDEKTATNIITIIDSGPILVALDFTADSEAALLWGCNYANCVGAPVIGLHVVHDPGDAPGYYRKADEDLLRPLEDVAADMMEEFLERVRGEHPEMETLKSVETVLVKGIPPTRILEIAKSKGARLIVMGSRGRTGLPHLLLGSKAERVVQLAPVPVTIVKAKNHGS
jgi:nucleotide-binding universal stress UspA family protein